LPLTFYSDGSKVGARSVRWAARNRGRRSGMSESIDRRDAAVLDAIDGVVTGRMSRQDFLKRATALGLSAGAIGSILGALGSAEGDAAIRQRLGGQTISILIPSEGDEKSVQDKLGTIKQRFGIDIKVTALPVGPLIEKANQNLKAPTSAFDAIDVLGFSVSQMVGGGFFTRLNPYLKKAPAGYGFPADFPKGELKYVGFYDVKNQQFGGKDRYLIPGLHARSVTLFYRQHL